MAQGDVVLFDEFAESIGDGRIDLDTDTFKVILSSLQAGGTATISKTTAVPTYGAGGTTDLTTAECANGGGYTTGGATLTKTWVNSSGTCTWDAANVTWTSSASGDPADVKTAIIYSDTASNKDAIGFIDMTADGTTALSMLTDDITITFATTGIFSVINP